MPRALKTRVCELLDAPYPILQTGMGWVATPELTAAACNAGAFGFLAAATIPPEAVEAEKAQPTQRPNTNGVLRLVAFGVAGAMVLSALWSWLRTM